MVLPPYIVISFTIEGVLLLFHLSVFFVIASNVSHKVTTFSTAFYKFYLAQCVADYLVYAMNPLFARLQFFDILPSTSFDIQAVGVTQYFLSAYGSYFIYFSYLVIACNRYTAILKPFQHAMLWSCRRMVVIFALLVVVPAPLAAVRVFFVIAPLPLGTTGYVLSNIDPLKGKINGYISAGTCIATCACTLTINLHTFLAYRKLSQQNQRNYLEEYHLL
ncbi:hypothetical protein AAVH_25153, partial [Aphelenchoides avenae]